MPGEMTLEQKKLANMERRYSLAFEACRFAATEMRAHFKGESASLKTALAKLEGTLRQLSKMDESG